MKNCLTTCFTLIIIYFASIVFGIPVDNSNNAQILRYDNENIGLDGYKFAYETSDGVSRSEEAQLKDIGAENQALTIRGTITWVAADGQTYTLNYVADENGFQPQGAHLPR